MTIRECGPSLLHPRELSLCDSVSDFSFRVAVDFASFDCGPVELASGGNRRLRDGGKDRAAHYRMRESGPSG